MIDRILDNNGDIRKSYPDSAHNVSAFGGIHWKQKPTHPLMEYAIHNLIFRVTGGLTPSVELVRLRVTLGNVEKTYPVLLSKTIPGKTLKETSVPDLQSSQWARWSWMLLCAILTRPGDGRLSNYVLDPDNNIFCIDNDIAFVEPAVKEFMSRKVNFCSALFCLFPNRPLDPKVLEEFSGLNVDALLKGWIEDVIKQEQEYLSLFPDPIERSRLYEEDPNNRFKATILFRKGALVTLNFQFTFLQNFLRSAFADKREVKASDLLAQLIHMREINMDNTTGKYVSKIYTKANQSTIDAKLKWITSRDQSKSLTSLQSDQACLGKIPTLEEIGRGEYSPAEARKELFGCVLNRSAQYISIGMVDGQRTLQVSFKHLAHDQERQSLVLEAITYLATQEKPTALALQYCDALNSTTLAPFLHPGLESLDLRFCSELTDNDVVTIQKKCSQLKKLYLSGCVKLKYVSLYERYPTPLEFESLQELHIEKCANLTSLRLKAPQFKTLIANHNPELSQIDIPPCFPELQHCPRIEERVLDSLLERALLGPDDVFIILNCILTS